MTTDNLRQEINFFKIFRAPPPLASILTWRRLILSYLLGILFFLLLTLFTWWQVHSLNEDRKYLVQQSDHYKKMFYSLKKHYPSFFFTQDVNNLLEQFQKNIESQQKLLQSIINKKPFSSDLILIAETIKPGNWLTGIVINKNGDEIIFKGHSLNMSSLQVFLDSLLGHKRFFNYTLEIKKIDQANNL